MKTGTLTYPGNMEDDLLTKVFGPTLQQKFFVCTAVKYDAVRNVTLAEMDELAIENAPKVQL